MTTRLRIVCLTHSRCLVKEKLHFHYYCADRAQIVARLPTVHRSITTWYMYFGSSQLLYELSPCGHYPEPSHFYFYP